MTRAQKVLSTVVGAGLLTLASVKVFGPAGLDVLNAVVTFIEAVIGTALLAAFCPRLMAWATALLGAALTAWTLWSGPDTRGGADCGCFGGLHVPYPLHVLIAALILAAGIGLVALAKRQR